MGMSKMRLLLLTLSLTILNHSPAVYSSPAGSNEASESVMSPAKLIEKHLFRKPVRQDNGKALDEFWTVDNQWREDSEEDENGAGREAGQVLNNIFNFYLPQTEYIDNEECQTDVRTVNFAANIRQPWALRMVDSWGKLPDGVFFGNFRAVGMYEECLKVEAQYNTSGLRPEQRNYTGRYCSVSYTPKEEEAPESRSGVAFVTLVGPLPFTYGTCIPSSCTTEDLSMSLNQTLDKENVTLVRVICHSEDDPSDDFIPEDTAMLVIISIFASLVIVATVYDAIIANTKIKPVEMLVGFSFSHNMRRVFTYDDPIPGDTITCLPGLRVITLLWIIIAHQYEAGLDFIANTFDILKYQDPTPSQVVTNPWLAVDTFLFMTGLVLTFRFLPYLRPGDRPITLLLHFLKALCRRFFRLAPIIFVVALFCASLLRFLGMGPRAYLLEEFSLEKCGPHWWKDPLFFNNFISDRSGTEVTDCLNQCWYTAVDMQLFLILPVLILPYVYHKIAGVLVVGLVLLVSILAPLGITIANDLPPTPLTLMSPEQHLEYMWRVYLVPWCRAAPWVVGVGTAMALRNDAMTKCKLNKFLVIVGYLVAVGLGLTLVLGLYDYNHVVPTKDWREYPGVAATYGSLARPLWGLCLAWVVLTCHTGNAHSVDRILSWPGWRPLARVTFCMYITSPVVQVWWSTVLFVPIYYNYLAKLLECAGVFFISGLFSLLLTCFFELPINTIVNAVMPSPAKQREREAGASVSESALPLTTFAADDPDNDRLYN